MPEGDRARAMHVEVRVRSASLAVVVITVLALIFAGSLAFAAKSDPGMAIFKKNCGSCHMLKAAKTKGKVGPNLNSVKLTAARVNRQVTNGGGVMPSFKGKLTKTQIVQVAAFVAKNSGKQ